MTWPVVPLCNGPQWGMPMWLQARTSQCRTSFLTDSFQPLGPGQSANNPSSFDGGLERAVRDGCSSGQHPDSRVVFPLPGVGSRAHPKGPPTGLMPIPLCGHGGWKREVGSKGCNYPGFPQTQILPSPWWEAPKESWISADFFPPNSCRLV